MPRPPKDGLYKPSDSPYWYCRWHDNNGNLQRKSTGQTDKLRAEQIYNRYRIEQSGLPDPNATITVNIILDLYHKEKGKHSKRQGYNYARNQLLDWFAGADWDQLGKKGDPKRINKYIQYRQEQGVGAATINIEIGMLSAAANVAIDEGYDIRNHARSKRLTEPQPNYVWLTPEQGTRLLQACKPRSTHKSSPHLLDFTIIALGTGMRTSEILSLQKRQIDVPTAVIRLQNTKSGNPHEVPMTNEVFAAIKRCMERSEASWLFYNAETGGHLTTIAQQLKRACKRAGITISDQKRGIVGFKCYGLRHTFACWLLEGGASLEEIGDLLNHQDPRTTKRYAHHTKDGRKRTLTLLPKIQP